MSSLNSTDNAHFRRISPHIWVIHGSDKARFPSGNALYIKTPKYSIIVDTNPGYDLINQAFKEIGNQSADSLTDIILSHTHLDHGRGLTDLFESSQANVHAHPDTLQRCEAKRKIGMFAGVPKEKIQYFEKFGDSLGFQDRHYPKSNKMEVYDGAVLQFDTITIKAHESSGHCPHLLDYEIVDGSTRIILSCDYDFSLVPWYGAPQRGESISLFLQGTKDIIQRNPDMIISSHRIEPILPQNYLSELSAYQKIISQRTNRIVNLLTNEEMALAEIRNFVYPVDKMGGRYSDSYVNLAIIWDAMLALCHLEAAWSLGEVECVDAGGDTFLDKCISNGIPIKHDSLQKIEEEWAIKTLAEDPGWQIPMNSKWRKKSIG